jgi:polysaccharide biosynthesis protein PelA
MASHSQKNQKPKMALLRFALFSFGLLFGAPGFADPAVALFYGEKAPLAELKAFDIVVVEPDHGYDPLRYHTPDSELFAYVAVAEVQPSRPYFKEIPAAWKMARNNDWGSDVLNQTPAEWPDFFADKIVGPLWNQGYRGFFLDTLDSYRLAKNFDEATQQEGLVRVIETLHRRFPGIRLILNRGFEIIPRVRDKVFMVAAESLFRGWNAGAQRYEEVKASDREWLLTQLKTIKEGYGLPVLAIDYVTPGDRQATRETAERIRAQGFIPWVTDSNLDSLGIGQIEVIPRRILIIYDSRESTALNYTPAHRFLQMPLNYLGYTVDYADVNLDLPKNKLTDRYAGIVTWFSGQVADKQLKTLPRWIKNKIEEGIPIAVIGDFGYPIERNIAGKLGITELSSPVGTLHITNSLSMLGFETPPKVNRTQLTALGLTKDIGKPILELGDQRNNKLVGGALMPWGGFILNPFVLIEIPGTEQTRWIVDPFTFLTSALGLKPLPAPDVTTENGRRLFFSHVDGDGFPSLAEFAGSPPAAEVMLKEIIERYQVPTTVSIIESEISPDGLYPKLSPRLESIAKRIFTLPHVEIASHTYTHPFIWEPELTSEKSGAGKEESYHLEIPGYKFDLTREIVGSSDYIQRRLAPPKKPVKILLWSGDTAPGAEALAITEKAGLLNMNGGDTSITRSNPSLTAVGALGIQKNGFLQVYAPITNENIYTNLWRGPFYGYERVIESFEMTETPRRLKPVDIYYHTYSASKRAGLNALRKAHDWAAGQPLHPIFASEYIRKVQDFYDMSLAREGSGWRVRSHGNLRTIRLPTSLGTPNLDSSIGIAGFSASSEGNYVHLTGSSAWFSTGGEQTTRPYLYDANGRLDNWQNESANNKLSFSLAAHQPLTFRMAQMDKCQTKANGRPISPMRSETLNGIKLQQFRLNDAAAKIQISCPAH